MSPVIGTLAADNSAIPKRAGETIGAFQMWRRDLPPVPPVSS